MGYPPSNYPDNEGLQVSIPQTPEVAPHNTLPEVAPNQPFLGEKYDDGANPVQNTILGIKKRTFWIVLPVCVLVILAAAIGGGVGGALSHKSSTSSRNSAAEQLGSTSTPTSPTSTSLSTSPTSSPSTSPTSASVTRSSTTGSTTSSTTTSSHTPFPTSGILSLDCPAISGTSYTSTQSQTNYTFGLLCGVNYPNNDLHTTNTSTVSECMDACASYDASISGSPCKGLVWNANLTLVFSVAVGNCFLKSAVSDGTSSSSTSTPIDVAAILNSVVAI